MGLLISQILLSALGLWLATLFVPGVEFTGSWQLLFLAGIILGVLNFFIRPLLNKIAVPLKIITLPLKIVTLGLSGFVINMLMVWIVDIFFPELIIPGLWPLFWTTLITWGISYILSKLFGKEPAKD
jgi:putative membrane protein